MSEIIETMKNRKKIKSESSQKKVKTRL